MLPTIRSVSGFSMIGYNNFLKQLTISSNVLQKILNLWYCPLEMHFKGSVFLALSLFYVFFLLDNICYGNQVHHFFTTLKVKIFTWLALHNKFKKMSWSKCSYVLDHSLVPCLPNCSYLEVLRASFHYLQYGFHGWMVLFLLDQFVAW